jgi:selenocysteine lyase/cysteine desulfurase
MEHVRKQFPGLANGWTFFDNAGGTQILSRVVDRMNDFLFNMNVQTGGSYDVSIRAAAALHSGREAMMHLVNASRPEEIAFAASTTVALQNLARSMESQFREGDEVIVTVSDHESNIGPWVGLEKLGVNIKTWNVNREVHKHGALICVDSVAFAPHRAIDVSAWDIDFLALSVYKVFGPHVAVLYGKYDLFAELDNLYHYFYDKDKIPAKLEPGNASYELAYSSTGIVDYLAELGESAGDVPVRQKIELALLLSYLRSRDDCRIIGRERGDDPRRVPTISFAIESWDPGEIARRIDAYNIAIRFGDFHARRLIEYLGLDENNGVVRVSMTHYNTLTEVDALIAALGEVLDGSN